MLVPFLPYVLVSLLQLVALAAGAATLAAASKWLLMPALGLALVLAAPRTRRARRVVGPAAAGILFSWLGDVLLGTPGGLGFLLGLGAFLLAHVSYLVLFARGLRTRPVPVWAVVLVPWWVALLVVLGPHLGALFVPVAVYGLVLGGSAALALATNRFSAVGALLFLASDTVLALKLFLPGFALWQADAVIMLLYLLGEGLIVFGAVRSPDSERSPSPVPQTG